jgi:hypothetical protein
MCAAQWLLATMAACERALAEGLFRRALGF